MLRVLSGVLVQAGVSADLLILLAEADILMEKIQEMADLKFIHSRYLIHNMQCFQPFLDHGTLFD